MGRIYIDKYTGRIERTDVYRVKVILKDGTVIHNLEPRRLFPLSNLTMYITLLDESEKEVAFVSQIINLLDLHIDKKTQYANAKFTCRLLEWIDEIQSSEQDKNDLISEATLFINANIETDINVKNLAKQFGYCEKHIRSIS